MCHKRKVGVEVGAQREETPLEIPLEFLLGEPGKSFRVTLAVQPRTRTYDCITLGSVCGGRTVRRGEGALAEITYLSECDTAVLLCNRNNIQ